MNRKGVYIDRVGMRGINSEGCEMIIVEYISYNNITVEFQDEYKARVNRTYNNFKKGNIKNPYFKSVYAVGYLGIGKFKSTKNGKITREYDMWHSMLSRCYCDKYQDNYPTYKGCEVCRDWHNFQNFAKWYHENYYEIDGQRMCLDKDILVKGNKIYSPETCIFVSNDINLLFIKNDRVRGDCPIGVAKKNGRFRSYVSIGTIKQIHLGMFDTQEEAFNVYKNFKEKYIKQVADEYKDKIPKKLYDAMYNYKVEITD